MDNVITAAALTIQIAAPACWPCTELGTEMASHAVMGPVADAEKAGAVNRLEAIGKSVGPYVSKITRDRVTLLVANVMPNVITSTMNPHCSAGLEEPQ